MRISRKAVALVLALLVTAGAFGSMMAMTEPPPSARPSNIVQLTNGSANHIEPAYSPNGKFIAFTSNLTGSYSVWMMGVDGRKQTRMTWLQGDEISPKWSPNGSGIAFVWHHGSYSDLCIVSLAKNSPECVTDGSHVRDYAWSPDGLLIAYDAGNGTILIYNTKSGLHTVFPFDGYVMDPTFGPNQGVLYFSLRTDRGEHIWNASLDGSRARQLSWEGSDVRPQVSPSGNYLMYLTNLSGRYEPWLVDLSTGINNYLLSRPDLGVSYLFPRPPLLASGTLPSWGPSGNNILYISNLNGTSGILFLVTLDVAVDPSQISSFPLSIILNLNLYNAVPLNVSVSDAQWSPSGNVVVETAVSGFQQLVVLQNGPPVHVSYGG